MRSFFPLLTVLALLVAGSVLPAAEPFLKPHDVIAFVGGEDMVAASEYGYLELLLTRALPGYQLRFRDLAREGDTVFEQLRDLNYPTLEQQLDKIGATVVIAQFGQMESLAGKEKLPEFIAAYEKLIERINGGGKRRVVLFQPSPVIDTDRQRDIEAYRGAVNHLVPMPVPGLEALPAVSGGARVVPAAELYQQKGHRGLLRDGIHLNASGQIELAYLFGHQVSVQVEDYDRVLGTGLEPDRNPQLQQQLQLIRAKNRLWSNYWRPQNWAFLNGDRTTQPSSRDHLDPSKRWFPVEIEEFVPLIEAKEREIDALAAKLAKP